MINFEVLTHFGTTNEQLKTFFTKKDGTPQSDHAKKFCKWVSGLIDDGRTHSMRYYRFYAAADLMWDGPPILQENVPLTAYAQRKIDVVSCAADLERLGCADKFVETVNKGVAGEKKQINLQRLQEVCVNIGRSYISRRVDAQCNKYNNLAPAFKYDPRDKSLVGRFRAEAMSEYADIMASAYDYKHKQRQAIRGMLSYGRSFMFPAGAWDYDTQIDFAPDDYAGEDLVKPEDGDTTGKKLRSVITREGVMVEVVHPSKVVYDTAYPPASINTDTGCGHIGFWDVKKYGDLCDNPNYFNVDKISYSSKGGSIYTQNRAYFDLIYAGQAVNFPAPGTPAPSDTPGAMSKHSVDLAAKNDRDSNQGLYTREQSEQGVFVTDFRVKVVPRDWGMGKYPKPVWLRVLVASDDTVIFAEWMPSIPAIYWGHNEDDSKMINLGQMHEIMPWQDQLSNIMSQLLMTMKRTLAQIWVLNKDVIDAETISAFETAMKGDGFYMNPKLLKVSYKKLQSMGFNVKDGAMQLVAPDQRDQEYINNAFKAIVQILALVERLMMLSPQEQAQPAPREITAAEVAAVESTTQVKFNAISESIDEARSAWKRLTYESAMAFGSDQVELAVAQTFSPETIKKAGFKVKEPEAEKGSTAEEGRTVIGSKTALLHNYVFTNRDGGNRVTDAQSANVLISAMNTVIPLIGQSLGKRRIFEIVNEIFRRTGAFNLVLETKEGEDDTLDNGEEQAAADQQNAAVEQRIGQLETTLQQLAGAQQQSQETVKTLIDVLRNGADLPIRRGEVAPGVPGPAPMPV